MGQGGRMEGGRLTPEDLFASRGNRRGQLREDTRGRKMSCFITTSVPLSVRCVWAICLL